MIADIISNIKIYQVVTESETEYLLSAHHIITLPGTNDTRLTIKYFFLIKIPNK